MEYKIHATQTIHKFFEIEAEDNGDALEKAQEMISVGDVRFDNEPFIEMEVNVDVL